MYELVPPPELPLLSPEIAARINGHFLIEVYGVNHGHTAEQLTAILPVGMHPTDVSATATDEQRAVTRALVEELTPDDTLFREAYGYIKQQPRPADRTEPVTAEQLQRAKDLLKAEQDNYDAISYGSVLAMLNDVPVIKADCNAEQQAAHHAANAEFNDDASKDRVTAALATVINHAIEHLPPADEPIPDPVRRRRLMVLFGGAHANIFKKIVAEAGLPVLVYHTEQTQLLAIQAAARKALSSLLDQVLPPPDSTS